MLGDVDGLLRFERNGCAAALQVQFVELVLEVKLGIEDHRPGRIHTHQEQQQTCQHYEG